jgi:hypothetical protein
VACRAAVAAFHNLHTFACCSYPADTFAFVVDIEGMERMGLVPTVVVAGIGLACVGPCRILDVASAVLEVGGCLVVGLQHLVVGEQQMIAARTRVLHFSGSRRPLPLGQCRSRNRTRNISWLEKYTRMNDWLELTISDLARAEAISDLCNVLRLFSSACIQARIVSSVMKMSHPFAKRIGASAEIILTSGSAFMTFLIRASGSWWSLKSCSSVSNRVT